MRYRNLGTYQFHLTPVLGSYPEGRVDATSVAHRSHYFVVFGTLIDVIEPPPKCVELYHNRYTF